MHRPQSFFAFNANSSQSPFSDEDIVPVLLKPEDVTALPKYEPAHFQPPPSRASYRDYVFPKMFGKLEPGEIPRTAASSVIAEEEEEENPHHSRMMIWLVLCTCILLALAVILGAVLGTFINPGHSKPAAPTPEVPAASPTPGPTPIPRPGDMSSLTATGWSVDGDDGYYVVQLFSQDKQGYLSRSIYNSSTGNWTTVNKFASTTRGAPMAAAALKSEWYTSNPNYTFPGIHYQTELIYLDQYNYVTEWVFPDNGPEAGLAGSLNQQKHTASTSSRVTFYWPRLIYQDGDGSLHKVNFQWDGASWTDSLLKPPSPTNGSQLAIIPSKNGLSATDLYYQEETGRFVDYHEERDGTLAIWTNDAFAKSIPSSSSIASFSTVRTGRTDGVMNTYILFQDTDNSIKMSWADDDSGWKGPESFDALQGADKNTAITCLTGLTFPGFPMTPGNLLSRCYFQAEGKLREVYFDGKTWINVGDVPVNL